MQPFRMPMRVVFYREDGRLFAHSLEFDLIGDGDDHRAAMANLMDAIATQVHATAVYNNPGNLFTPADPEIWERFAAGLDTLGGELEITEYRRRLDNVELQGVHAREYTPTRASDPTEAAHAPS